MLTVLLFLFLSFSIVIGSFTCGFEMWHPSLSWLRSMLTVPLFLFFLVQYLPWSLHLWLWDVTCHPLTGASDEAEAERAMKEFAQTYNLKSVEDVHLITGLTIERLNDGSIGISQAPYLVKVLQHFDLWNIRPLGTPLQPNSNITRRDGALTNDKAAYMADKPFCQLLGSLHWASSGTRPDITFACSSLSRVQANPAPEHWLQLVNLCRYTQGTLDYGLLYKRQSESQPSIKPIGFVNADWAGCRSTRRSTSGYLFLVGGTPVGWSSKLQPFVTLSTIEVEYVSLTRGGRQAM